MLPTRFASMSATLRDSTVLTADVTQSSPEYPGLRAWNTMSGRSTKYPFWLNTVVLYGLRSLGVTYWWKPCDSFS